MNIYKLNKNNIPIVAKFMSGLNPIFWEYDGAAGQLSGTESSISTIGWFLGDDESRPKGWVLCRELWMHKSIELECCGYDDGGVFAAEHKLGALFDAICEHAKCEGFLSFRTSMGSQEFNIHQRELGDIGDEIKSLSAPGRVDYSWLLGYGFKVIGIQPNAYGNKFHCILLSKDIR